MNSAWVETTYRLISDSLGTPRYAVNVTNKDDVKYQVSYSPLGEPTVEGGLAASTISWIPFGFAGGLYDPDTRLVHFGARDYDPQIGRWISKDPIRFGGNQPNFYVYVNNDPINHRDPRGLAGELDYLKSKGTNQIPFWDELKYCALNPRACSLGAAVLACVAVGDALFESSDEMDKRTRDAVADDFNRDYYQNSEHTQSQDTYAGGQSIDPYSGGWSSGE